MKSGMSMTNGNLSILFFLLLRRQTCIVIIHNGGTHEKMKSQISLKMDEH